MIVYRIVGWKELYENNRTRDMKSMQWVPVPIKHDGFGYCTLVSKNGAARLGAWIAILQTAAKSHPRGTLLRDGRHPHTAETIAVKTRLDPDIIRETIEACMHDSVGWIECVDAEGIVIEGAEIPHPPARNGMEWKGMEGKGKEGKKDKRESVGKPPVDLVFEQAWKAYGCYGAKPKARAYWIKLNQDERDAILKSIPTYLKCVDAGRSKKQFEGWINPENRLWEIDWASAHIELTKPIPARTYTSERLTSGGL